MYALWAKKTYAGDLSPEEIVEDAEIAARLSKEPPRPPLDLAQLCALKAQLRALVPGIHEVPRNLSFLYQTFLQMFKILYYLFE